MMKTVILVALMLLGFPVSGIGQRAELHLANTSARNLTVKVMEWIGPSQDTLYSTISVQPNGRATEYFAKTGHYFLKTEAVLKDKEPMYTKGNPFRVYVGTDGYSVLTITYSITESNMPDPLSGKRISKREFDQN